jgi:hypothetical protein
MQVTLIFVLACLCVVGSGGSIYAMGLLRDLQQRPDARSQASVDARAAAVLMNFLSNAISLVSSLGLLTAITLRS